MTAKEAFNCKVFGSLFLCTIDFDAHERENFLAEKPGWIKESSSLSTLLYGLILERRIKRSCILVQHLVVELKQTMYKRVGTRPAR